MKIVLQRVAHASVSVGGEKIAQTGRGLLVLFAAEKGDEPRRADFLAEKTVHLRIFPDAEGKMNLSVKDISGEILVVSQFTLAADCAKGRRPGFDRAAKPDAGEKLYRHYIDALRSLGINVETGQFGADMQVELLNDGPATFIL